MGICDTVPRSEQFAYVCGGMLGVFWNVMLLYRGVACVILGAILLSACEILQYIDLSDSNTFSITFWMGAVGLLIAVIIVLLQRPTLPTSSGSIALLILNSLVVSTQCIIYVLSNGIIGPADSVAICYSSPVVAIILSHIFLGENVSFHHVPYIFLSLVGVAFVVQPSWVFHKRETIPGDSLGYILAALTAILIAVTVFLSRKLGRDVAPCLTLIGQMIAQSLTSIVVCTILDLWRMPESFESGVTLVATALAYSIGFYFIYLSLTLENVKIVSIVLTSEIIFTRVGEVLFIGLPWDWYAALGSSLLIIACIGIAIYGSDGDRTSSEGDGTTGEEVEHTTEMDSLISERDVTAAE